MSGFDLSILFVYLVFVLSLGLYFARRHKSTEDYFLAGRNVPGWVMGFSVMGTIVSSATFIGGPGASFNADMWMVPYYITLPIIIYFLSRWLVPFYRHHVRMSAYEYLGQRFSYPAQAYGSGVFAFNRTLDMSVTFYYLAVAIAFLTDWDIWWVVLLLGLCTVLYTLIGGITAVVWTDVLQGGLLVGGGLLCLGVVLFGSPFGPSAVASTAWEAGKFGWGNYEFSLTEDNFWLYLIGGALTSLQIYGTSQTVVQRYLLARSDEEARRGAFAGVSACVPVWFLFGVLGACLWGFYEVSGAHLPTAVGEVQDNIVPHFVKTQVPVGLIGLLLAGLVASAMSSLDSDLNSIGAVVVQDFYCRAFPDASDRQQLLAGRIAVSTFGILAVFLAQQWIGIESFARYGVVLASIAGGGILGLCVLGFLFPRVTAAVAEPLSDRDPGASDRSRCGMGHQLDPEPGASTSIKEFATLGIGLDSGPMPKRHGALWSARAFTGSAGCRLFVDDPWPKLAITAG